MELFNNEPWTKDAACRGMGPELFFIEAGGYGPDNDPRTIVCEGCPVKRECLEYALPHDKWTGVWGGTSDRERIAIRRGWNRRGVA